MNTGQEDTNEKRIFFIIKTEGRWKQCFNTYTTFTTGDKYGILRIERRSNDSR